MGNMEYFFFIFHEKVLPRGLRVHLGSKTLWVQGPTKALCSPLVLGNFLFSSCLNLLSCKRGIKVVPSSLICRGYWVLTCRVFRTVTIVAILIECVYIYNHDIIRLIKRITWRRSGINPKILNLCQDFGGK